MFVQLPTFGSKVPKVEQLHVEAKLLPKCLALRLVGRSAVSDPSLSFADSLEWCFEVVCMYVCMCVCKAFPDIAYPSLALLHKLRLEKSHFCCSSSRTTCVINFLCFFKTILKASAPDLVR